MSGDGSHDKQAAGRTKALEIEFVKDKDFKACPFKLKVDIQKSCHFVLNVPLANEISRMFAKALNNQKLDFEYFKQLALEQIAQVRKVGVEYAEMLKKGKI